MSEKNKVPNIFFLLSSLSFLPVIGIIIGIILLIILYKETFTNKKIVNGIIIVGISSSFVFYFFISQTYIWGNVYHHPTVVESTKRVTNLVDKIEIHKKKYGSFPNSLNDLKNPSFGIDPILVVDKGYNDSLYFYKLEDDGYYLFSKGFDKTPFTSDDIFPNIKCINKGSYKLINCIEKKKRR